MNELRDNVTVIKASAGAQMVSDCSLLQRKSFNLLYANAKPNLLHANQHRINLNDLAKGIGYTSRNQSYLKSKIKDLMKVQCEWNVFGKDDEAAWEACAVLISEVIFVGSECYYTIPPTLSQLLANPRLYYNLDLDVQKRFSCKYALPLWEFLVDVLGAKRHHTTKTLSLDEVKKLLNIKSKSADNFKYLQRDILQPAQDEINDISNIKIKIIPEKEATGKTGAQKVTKLKFEITKKPPEPTVVLQPALELSFDDPDFIQKTLVGAFKINPAVVRTIRAKYSEEKVNKYIQYTNSQANKGKVNNIAAFFVKAIEGDWDVGDVETSSSGGGTAKDEAFRRSMNEDIKKYKDQLLAAETFYINLSPEEQQKKELLFQARVPHGLRVDMDIANNNVHSNTKLQNAFYKFLFENEGLST